MVAPRQPPKSGSNTVREGDNSSYSVDMGWDEFDRFAAQIPKHIRDWMEYEAPVPYNPAEVLEFKKELVPPSIFGGFEPVERSWESVFMRIKAIAHSNHRRAFGGVHPGLDRPRQVW